MTMPRFMHDKKPSDKARQRGAGFGYVCNENVCKNSAHVLNVHQCEFEEGTLYLGILLPAVPRPTDCIFMANGAPGGWGPNF